MSDLIEITDEERVRDALAVLVCASWDAEDYLPEDFDGSPLYEAGYLSSSQDITGEWETRLTPKGRALIKAALDQGGSDE